MDLQKLDRLFALYNYEKHEHDNNHIIYLLNQGMYYGAEIILLNENYDASAEKTELQNLGYACMSHYFPSIDDVEKYLFEGFFQVKVANRKIESRYSAFAEKLMEPYHDSKLKYEYIEVPYTYSDSDSLMTTGIIEKVSGYLKENGACLIIVEAAAGFGKTCTAYELYHSFAQRSDAVKPLFTELSRNREAKQFKYVLWSEIDNEYGYTSFGTDLVVYNIKKGNIPLIIDGFDELLTKDLNPVTKKKENDFEQVETMLSTIADLLDGNAKIILTSRKTAIFSGDNFYKWLDTYADKFKCVRFQIDRPRIENWLPQDRIQAIKDKDVPLFHLANPVLLTYLRNIKNDDFLKVIESPKTLTEKYFDFLLHREMTRQALLISVEDQMEIFMKLARSFALFDITSETRTFVKEMIIDDNQEILLRSKQLTSSKATTSELADTLTNHALMDRVGANGNVGFVNEFVLGTLMGFVLIDEKDLFNDDCSELPEDILEFMINAFIYQPDDNRTKLWNSLKDYKPIMSRDLKLLLDSRLINTIEDHYESETFNSMTFFKVHFSKSGCAFKGCIFTDCEFEDCEFRPSCFEMTTFIGCTFKGCSVKEKNSGTVINVYGCEDYRLGFIDKMKFNKGNGFVNRCKTEKDYESLLLERYFRVDGKSRKMKTISSLKDEFDHEERNMVFDTFDRLVSLGYIKTNGNNSHITNEGVSYYNKNLKKWKDC